MSCVRIVTFMMIVISTLMGMIVSPALSENPSLLMATTTSTDNTGLLDYLAPFFTKQTNIELRWTAVGTGKALELARRCDVDVLLVHAPEAEKKFIQNGYGVNRREIMYNDFIIIGPDSDLAGIRGKSVVSALHDIAVKKVDFISRGDQSGTHKQEILLWEKSGLRIPDKEPWYVQTGQGMLTTINIAAERSGYTFTDRGTYIKYESSNGGSPLLKILVEGDKSLMNQYSVIAVSKENCKKVKYDLAMRFSDWMAEKDTQTLIQNFKIFGKSLFTPNAR